MFIEKIGNEQHAIINERDPYSDQNKYRTYKTRGDKLVRVYKQTGNRQSIIVKKCSAKVSNEVNRFFSKVDKKHTEIMKYCRDKRQNNNNINTDFFSYEDELDYVKKEMTVFQNSLV